MSGDLAEVADKSVRGSLLLFLGEAGSTVILAVGFILVARFLGPEYYGVYSISFAVPAIIISLIGLGLDESIVRFSAKLRSENTAPKLYEERDHV
jgi:O-antigen/teichoic acid export membrane protein